MHCCTSHIEVRYSDALRLSVFSEVGHCEEGDKGNKGGGQHKSGWHWRMQRAFADTIPGSYAGCEQFLPVQLTPPSLVVMLLYSLAARFTC